MNYKILNPGGNKTALVFGTNYTDKEKKEINNEILSKNPEVEQVGFLDKKNKKLEMAGGEFCVNATRCSIWELLSGKEGSIKLRVSGLKEEIEGGITKDKKVYANMSINANLDELIIKEKNYTIVNLDGISFLIMNETNSKKYIDKLRTNETETKLELKQIMINSDIAEKALGVILLEANKIYPIVWVKAIDTLYYETACGSGSLATAICKYSENKINQMSMVQPSGFTIDISLEVDERQIKSAKIQGVVEE